MRENKEIMISPDIVIEIKEVTPAKNTEKEAIQETKIRVKEIIPEIDITKIDLERGNVTVEVDHSKKKEKIEVTQEIKKENIMTE